MNLVDQGVEGLDAVLGGAAVKDLGPPRVPGGQVAEGAHAFVLVLDHLAAATPGGQRLLDPLACLDRGLLVGADHVIAGVQTLAPPAAGVQVEDRAGALGEARVAREDPRAVLPGLDRVPAQPAPDRHAADLLDDPTPDRLARELARRPARQRHALLGRQRAGHRDHLSPHLRGERSGAGPAADGPQDRPGVTRRTASATEIRPHGGSSAAPRSGRCPVQRRPATPSARASPANTATYTNAPATPAPPAHRR
jgi:hypothetical protein